MPCPAGTHQNTSVRLMISAADCVVCPIGTACSVGASQATDCSPGTYNALEAQATCTNCALGSYQNELKATSCKQCTPGNYCGEGASAPLPCPAGRHQNASLPVMTTSDECVVCPVRLDVFEPWAKGPPLAGCTPKSDTRPHRDRLGQRARWAHRKRRIARLEPTTLAQDSQRASIALPAHIRTSGERPAASSAQPQGTIVVRAPRVRCRARRDATRMRRSW